MKKVRLFAVAAAMGMFAATVNAAPTVTKEAYKATWGQMDEIVRAELGGKIVLPTATVTVTKQGRTTDKTKAKGVTGSFGTITLNCYEGLTDKIGKDTNDDGLVDYAVLTGNNGAGLTSDWYYDDTKFFPTAKTALYYLGMTSNGLGARFIAPNADAEKGWIVSSTHTKYATQADVVKLLVEKGLLEQITNEKGEVEKVNLNKQEFTTGTGSAKVVHGKAWKEITSANTRYGIEELEEYVVAQFDASSTTAVVGTTKYLATPYYEKTNTTPVAYFNEASGTDLAGKLLVVNENRYGELVIDSVSAVPVGGIAPVVGKVIVVYEDSKGNTSKYLTVTPAIPTSGAQYDMIWDEVSGSFKKVEKVITVADDMWTDAVAADIQDELDAAGQKAVGGLYKYNNPKNTTDKIIVNFDLGVYNTSLNVSGLNTNKETITITDGFNKDLTTAAVKLDGKWYPAVNNVEELTEFVRRAAGLATATNAFITKLDTEKVYSTITWLDGSKDEKYIPANPLAHYKATQCTYLIDETTVDAANVVVTSNAAEVNTNQYGVHAVKLTAKVGETVVGTKDIKVVIAPKYVREYKNGKVTSLKAYHLNGNLYSHTTFDYAKKSSTSVFYAQDGVTAVETQTNAIQ